MKQYSDDMNGYGNGIWKTIRISASEPFLQRYLLQVAVIASETLDQYTNPVIKQLF